MGFLINLVYQKEIGENARGRGSLRRRAQATREDAGDIEGVPRPGLEAQGEGDFGGEKKTLPHERGWKLPR